MRTVFLEQTLDSESREGDVMHASVDGSDWLWMMLMMGLWLVLLGTVVYLAVRMAQRPATGPKTEGGAK
jgi:flagellar biogenesis protein FliO